MIITGNLNAKMHQDIDTIPSVSEAVMALSHEGIYENVATYIVNRIDSIKKYFIKSKDDMNNFNEKDMTVQAQDVQRLANDISKLDVYLDMRKLSQTEIPITLGLNTTLLDGSSSLLSVSDDIGKLAYKYFDNIDTIISKILADLDYRRKLTPIKEDATVNKLSDDIQKVIDKLIDPTGTYDRRSIDKLIPNVKSLETIQSNLITINKHVTYKLVESIKEKINNIATKVNRIYDILSNEENDAGISRSTLNELAWNLDNAANFATKVTTIFYLTNQFNSMLINTVKEVKKAK